MKKMKKGKGVGLLALLSGGGGKSESEGTDVDRDDDEDYVSSKSELADDILTAMSDGDAEALAEALSAFVSACGDDDDDDY